MNYLVREKATLKTAHVDLVKWNKVTGFLSVNLSEERPERRGWDFFQWNNKIFLLPLAGFYNLTNPSFKCIQWRFLTLAVLWSNVFFTTESPFVLIVCMHEELFFATGHKILTAILSTVVGGNE